jgi:glycosyltransferase involved in cell wall biosynthesis
MYSLHVISSMLSGGAERCYLWLLHALKEQGHRVMAVNRPGSFVASELSGTVAQVHVPMRNTHDILSAWKISRTLKRKKTQVVLTYLSRASRLIRSGGSGGPVHVARFDGFYKLKYFRHAHAWVGVTKGLCDYAVREGLPADRVFHVPNFVDFRSSLPEEERAGLRRSLAIHEGALVIVAPGRFIRKKGFDVLLSAFSRLPADVGARPLHLVLVGDGKLRQDLERQAEALGVHTRVSWTGWLADPDPYYEIADVVAFPSRFEPHGNIIKEAWSHTKALVSTGTHGAEELIEEGATGLLVPVDDARAMANALLRVLRDEQLRKSLGDAGCERVRKQYSKDVIVDRYIELFEDLLSRR